MVTAQDGQPRLLLDGYTIFKLMDTYGLPLDLINDLLREKNVAFNAVEFVAAALASKNFTCDAIKKKIINSMVFDEATRAEVSKHLDYLCGHQAKLKNATNKLPTA